MCCDYYIQSLLVIEYLDKIGRSSVIYTNSDLNKGYISTSTYKDFDSDNDIETPTTKYETEIKKIITKNTYNKILFDNNDWLKKSYKKHYEEFLKRDFKEIIKIKKIYKKVTAWERN